MRTRDPQGKFMPIQNENADSTSANAGEGENSPSYVTQDQLAAVVNAAVSSHLKRSLDKSIGSALASALEPFKERLSAPATQPDEKPAKGAPQPEVAALQKQLSDMQARFVAAQEEASNERARAREHKAFADLKSELNGKVRPEALDMAAEWLFHARKRVQVDEEGNALFTIRQAPAKGMPEQDTLYPLSDGVREFLKSKEASLFLPSPGAAKGQVPQAQRQAQPVQRGQAQMYSSPATSEEEKIRRAAESLAANGMVLP
jgi:hypothetical protein